MIDESHEGLRQILQSSERPRALTKVEERRMLARLNATEQFGANPRPPEVVELEPNDVRERGRSQVGSWIGWVASAAAAVSLLFVVVSSREPTQPGRVFPLDTVPTVILPEPDEPAAFCTDHVDTISEALERWRGLENWAFSGGIPDVGQLVDEALLAAAELGSTVVTERASDARERLRAALDQIETTSGRDAMAPRYAAVDDALESIGAISREITPPCDLTRLDAARDLE